MDRIAFTFAVVAALLGACREGPVSQKASAKGTQVAKAENACSASGAYGFVCGPQNSEDLVLVPGTPWIIASGMARSAAIYLVHSERKTWAKLFPANATQAEQDAVTFPSCPGPPDPDNFITHGLNLRRAENGRLILYAVSHGGREAVEVFTIDASGSEPVLTWTGCVMMPPGLMANSVASFSDGSLVATVEVQPDKTFEQVLTGEPTGAVYEWSPGKRGFQAVAGTALPGNNGIEVSADGTEIFVVAEGLRTIVVFDRHNPARQLRTTRPLAFIPDNIHMADDGRLITAGTIYDEPACGGAPHPEGFDLEAFAACPRGFIAAVIDPQTMRDTELAAGPANSGFSNVTMALRLGAEVWLGTFAGDRIGYVPIENGN